jgi:BirA family biotin operon repressor/biotin-[acetyl-CoA-carboxylase] ligase
VSDFDLGSFQPWPVNNPWVGAPVLHRERTRSTMEDALKLYELGYPDGTVAVAGFQERGRGRLPERSWESEPGKNLLFTILLTRPLSFPAQRLPVLAGLALSLAVEEGFGLASRVKWPNDLLHEGRKLAGVLCEARSVSGGRPVFLAGVGVNANQRTFAAGLGQRACSLAQALDREVDLPDLLRRILDSLFAVLQDTDWRGKLEGRLAGLGRPVTVAQPQGTLQGVLRGVDGDGALLLEADGQVQRIYSGELRLPRFPPRVTV